MATQYDLNINEHAITRGVRDKKMSRGSVSFQPRLSFRSFVSVTENMEDEDVIDGDETEDTFHWWQWFVENKNIRRGFRILSLCNLITLLLSIPFEDIEDPSKHQSLLIQFIVITVLDFILAVLYTFHLSIRVRYSLFIRCQKKQSKVDEILTKYTDSVHILTLLGLVIFMWYSVAIEIYRCTQIDQNIFWLLYWFFIPRAFLTLPSVIKLFVPHIEASKQILQILNWRQLTQVTIFYIAFVFLFALIGVHIIGGLDHICVYDNNSELIPAVPLTHCHPNTLFCPSETNQSNLVCRQYPVEDINQTININYRIRVYYGQFRTILDALYAVYEASTLELWSFMMTSAINGRETFTVAIFYTMLVLFIVILLQQSIFLVVIIESFADIRSHSSWDINQTNSQKQPNKPSIVLSLQDNKLLLQSKKQWNPRDFILKYKSILLKVEKIFLCLVFIDAIMVSLKVADFPSDTKESWKISLQVWQSIISFIFLFEIIGIFLFHLYHGQWKLFIRKPYYYYLIILSIGGIVAGIPPIYNPLMPSNGLAVFQVLRFTRLIRISQALQSFFQKIMGNYRIPKLIVITLFLIVWLSVINAHIFGYLPERDEECNLTEPQFNRILSAFYSTFQLVLNEAWTDVTSEEMCGYKYSWLIINFYFIVIHLFSSLIFLNFFGAVILDNLEYDEEEKKAKLEEINQKETKPVTVPFHLRIFKKLNNQPKRLRPPGTGLNDPNIEESEVRRYFEPVPNPVYNIDLNDSIAPSLYNQKQPNNGSQLRQLSLVSTDGEDFFPSTTTGAFERKYQNISAMLNFVKLWRKHAEEERAKASRSSQLHFLFDSNRNNSQRPNAKSHNEFDEFREKHRCFDMSLFCMPPENKLRRLCTTIITAQAKPPVYVLKSEKVLTLFKVRAVFIFKWLLSQMPYFKWIMFFGLWSVIGVQLNDLRSDQSNSIPHGYNIITESLYVLLMLTWLLLRVISNGLFLNPNAAISSIWDVIDWLLLINNTLLLILIRVWHPYPIESYRVSIGTIEIWTQIMMGIRAFRSLHLISLFPSLRAVIRELLEGWKNLILAFPIMFGFMFMFANLGVQLFAGTDVDNPLAFCNDPNHITKETCIGEFEIRLDISREFLPTNSDIITILVPRVWFPYARDFPFNNVAYALVTLFELLTLEGWTEVRQLFEGKANAGAEKANYYMLFYIHTFVFLAVNLGLQLFLGIVVNNYNEHKPDHRFLLSVDQNRWVELMQRISLQRPYKLPPEPRDNYFRKKLYQLLTHKHYRVIPTVIVSLATVPLFIPWNNKLSVDAPIAVTSLISLSIFFNFYTIIEVFLKLLAFGPAYFQSWRNLFDMILAVVTVAYTIFGVIYLFADISLLQQLSYFALTIAVLKCITVLLKYSAMLNLLITVGSTILRTIPHLHVLAIIYMSYSLLGIVLFSCVTFGEAVNYKYIFGSIRIMFFVYSPVNFHGTLQSFSSMARSMTGEDWYQIMWDVALREPYGQSDPNPIFIIMSFLYFGSFIIIVPFILLNVFIAALLENFSIFYNDNDTKLNLSVIKDFKRKWHYFDSHAKGYIKASKIKLILRSLDLQDYYTYSLRDPLHRTERVICKLTEDPLLLWEMEEELRREVAIKRSTSNDNQLQSMNEETDDINIPFSNVLRMLAYRCEDINTRLESHELYSREELETTIQIDVAEMCIFKWLRKYVKPIVEWERDHQIINEEDSQTVTRTELSHADRQQQLFSLHNMQSQMVLHSWGKQPSLETEDEDVNLTNRRSRLFPVSTSEEQVSADQQDDVLERSFAKLAQSINPEVTKEIERAQEWWQMQMEWHNNIGKNEHYFDDHL